MVVFQQNLAVPVEVVTLHLVTLVGWLVNLFLATVVGLGHPLQGVVAVVAVLTLLVQTQVALLAALVAQGKQTLSQARQ
jgi:hypothetical protein